jgi:S-adenosyl-L-methionine hydrolase (adenosine-forming)
LTTDFGTADGYVGEMKGVLVSRAANVQVIDITHDIPPGDIDRARLTVARVWRRFPPRSIHLVVVDPGVGSSRAALVVQSDGRFLVGPDNGVLSPALLESSAHVRELSIGAGAAATFHGRDVFAPAAAALARGESFESLGAPLASPIVRRTPEPVRRTDGSIDGEVISIDRFGNAITNIIALRAGVVNIGDVRVPLGRTYASVQSGALIAVVGSMGFIEVAMRDGDAAAALGIARGARVLFAAPE